MSDPLLSRREAAAALGVSVTTVMRLLQTGALGAVKIGRLTKISPAAIEAFVKACPQGPSPRRKVQEKTTGLDGAV